MFLNNKYFSKGIYNGSIGVILRILNESLVEVIFPISTGMVIMKVEKDTTYFVVNGGSARRTQFPLQNAFSLTVHKTQGFDVASYYSLIRYFYVCMWPNICCYKQGNIMAESGHHVLLVDLISIKTDKRVIKEYERLLEENRTNSQKKYLIDI